MLKKQLNLIKEQHEAAKMNFVQSKSGSNLFSPGGLQKKRSVGSLKAGHSVQHLTPRTSRYVSGAKSKNNGSFKPLSKGGSGTSMGSPQRAKTVFRSSNEDDELNFSHSEFLTEIDGNEQTQH